MVNFLKTIWSDVVSPLVQRPPALQVAALCYRTTKSEQEILLVTSSNGRWILPKGWPIDGLLGHQTALQEAWEEAGVRKGDASKNSVGQYLSKKQLDNGVEVPCRTLVYPVKVKSVSDSYPEDDRRERRWVTSSKARELVTEPGLIEVLAEFEATSKNV